MSGRGKGRRGRRRNNDSGEDQGSGEPTWPSHGASGADDADLGAGDGASMSGPSEAEPDATAVRSFESFGPRSGDTGGAQGSGAGGPGSQSPFAGPTGAGAVSEASAADGKSGRRKRSRSEGGRGPRARGKRGKDQAGPGQGGAAASGHVGPGPGSAGQSGAGPGASPFAQGSGAQGPGPQGWGAQGPGGQGAANPPNYSQGPASQAPYGQGAPASYNQGGPAGGYGQGAAAPYNQGGPAGGYAQGAPASYNQSAPGGYGQGGQVAYGQPSYGQPAHAADGGGRRRGPLLAVIGLVVVAAAVVAGFFLLGRSTSEDADQADYVATSDGAGDTATDTSGNGTASTPDAAATPGAAATTAPAPTVAPTATVTPAPLIDCIGDVPCCVTGPYLPITEDTSGISFDSLVEPTESFGVRYVEVGPVGTFEFDNEDWFDFERLGETGIDRFIVAPRSSLSGSGCDLGAGASGGSGETTAPAAGGAFPVLIVDGIGELEFGNSTIDEARAVFDPLLGPATTTALAECPSGADTAVAWEALQMVFLNGRLDGWFYDGSSGGSPTLVTPSGVEIGMTEADMAAIYVGVTIQETSIGREFWYEVPSGVMSGLIEDGRVTSLWSGGVCIFR